MPGPRIRNHVWHRSSPLYPLCQQGGCIAQCNRNFAIRESQFLVIQHTCYHLSKATSPEVRHYINVVHENRSPPLTDVQNVCASPFQPCVGEWCYKMHTPLKSVEMAYAIISRNVNRRSGYSNLPCTELERGLDLFGNPGVEKGVFERKLIKFQPRAVPTCSTSFRP